MSWFKKKEVFKYGIAEFEGYYGVLRKSGDKELFLQQRISRQDFKNISIYYWVLKPERSFYKDAEEAQKALDGRMMQESPKIDWVKP